MNKKILLMLSTFNVCTQANSYNHYLIGGLGLNYIHAHTNLKNVNVNQLGTYNAVNNITTSNYNPGLMFGYGISNQRIFSEITYEFTNDRLKSKSAFNKIWMIDSYDNNAYEITRDTHLHYKHQGTHNLGLKIGQASINDINAYLKCSLIYSKFNVHLNYHGQSKTKHQYGFAPGIGIEKNINKEFAVRAEYSYRIYRRIKFKSYVLNDTYWAGDNLFSTTIKPREHHFGLNLVYKFNLSK